MPFTTGAVVCLLFLEKNRIAELVCAVVAGVELIVHPGESLVIGEGAQQFVVTGATFLSAGEDSVHYAKPGAGANPLRRQAFPGPYGTVNCGRVLQRPYHRRTNRDDTSPSL